MVSRQARILVCGVVLAVANGGCGRSALSEPRYVSLNPAAQEEFDRGRALFLHGHAAEAQQVFEGFIVRHPGDPLRSAAELHLGRIAVQRTDYSAALVWLRQAMNAVDEAVATTARRELGQVLIRVGDPGGAIEVLEPLAGRLDGADAAELYQLLAQAALAAEDRERHIRYLDGQCRFGGRQVCGETATVIHQVVSELEQGDLDRLFATLPRDGQAWAAVASRRGQLAVASGNRQLAATVLEDMEQAGADGGWLEALRHDLEQMEDVDWAAVGVLLPLSGRARYVGEQMRRGLELARGEDDQLRFVIRDSADPSVDVAGMVESLVQDERVAAIIGPVDSSQAGVAAAQADRLGVPLLALSIRPELPQASQWVFRPFQTNEAEVRLLTRHAMADQGGRPAAILRPSHGYGDVMGELILAEVTNHGGAVAAVREYPPTQTAFAEQCESLAQEDFQVLYLADRARTISLVAPALASAGLWSGPSSQRVPSDGRVIQILLPSAAFDPALVRRAGRYLQGAVFASVVWVDDPAPQVVQFVDHYRLAYGAAPSSYAVQAHDAARVLMAAKASATAHSRAGLVEALAALDGASTIGRFEGFDERGEPRASLHLYVFEGSTFRRLTD